MNTNRYQSIGSKAFSAGMTSFPRHEERDKTPTEEDDWWSQWDDKWINHYDEEWMAFIRRRAGKSHYLEDEDSAPCVWNHPPE
jgi:hypothetical protein